VRHPAVVSTIGVIEGWRVRWSSRGEAGARRRISVVELDQAHLLAATRASRAGSEMEKTSPSTTWCCGCAHLATCSRHLDQGRRGRTRGGGASGSIREEGGKHNEERSFRIRPCTSRHPSRTSPHRPRGPAAAALFLFDTSLVDASLRAWVLLCLPAATLRSIPIQQNYTHNGYK
jgi:hypothetical protein